MTDNQINMDERTGLVVMTSDECGELLTSTPIGRMVFNDGDQPLALPVNFAWVDDTVVFRTLEGQKLHAAIDGAKVCFEVDRWDEQSDTGASVLVKGQAVEVTQWAEQEQLEQLDVRPWSRQPWRQAWVRVIPNEITGRRLG